MNHTQSDAAVSPYNQQEADGSGVGSPEGPHTLPSTERVEPSSQASTWVTLWAVWKNPAQKGVSMVALLIFVTYLGRLSEKLENYGPLVAVDEKAMQLVDAWQGRSPELVEEKPHRAQAAGPPASSETEAVVQDEAGRAALKPGCPENALPRASALLPDGRIVLNEATVAELDTLPGIGTARAEAIVQLRERLKGFKKLADLLRIKGIGHKSFLKLKERLVLDRPTPEVPADVETSGAGATPAPSALRQPGTVPLVQLGTVPLVRQGTVPLVRQGTVPLVRQGTVPLVASLEP